MESDLLRTQTAYKPFLHPWAVTLAEEHEKIHWVESEVDLGEDVSQWKHTVDTKTSALTAPDREFITMILKLFTQSDVAVGHNYIDHLLPHFKNNEIRQMLISFAAREGTHQRAYALLNDTLGFPDTIYEEFLQYEEMKQTITLASDLSMKTPHAVMTSLAKEIVVEGVGLFAQFAMLLNYQRFGKMKGTCTIVEWSLRDESMHVEGLSELFKAYVNDYCASKNRKTLPKSLKDSIKVIVKELAEVEKTFCDLVFGRANGPIEGLTLEEMHSYIEFITNRRMEQIGLETVYEDKTNPIPWLDWIMNGADHSNFFEKRVTDYNAAGMTESWGWGNIYAETE